MTSVSSVKEQVTADTIYNEVRMLRSSSGKSFLLVEGSSDSKVLRRFSSDVDCAIVVCLGKANLFGAITKLEMSGVEGVLAFADRDFSDLIGYPEYNGVVVFTDENDLETQILKSSATSNILNEFGSSQKMASVIGKSLCNAHETIASWSAPAGALRLANMFKGWGLLFSEMSYQFAPANSPEICPKKTVRHVLSRSSSKSVPTEPEANAAVEEILKQYSPWALAHGHDCVAVLARSLRHKLGSTNEFNSKSGTDTLGKILRLSYEVEMFRATYCYRHIRFWENISGFIVLEDTRSEVDSAAA